MSPDCHDKQKKDFLAIALLVTRLCWLRGIVVAVVSFVSQFTCVRIGVQHTPTAKALARAIEVITLDRGLEVIFR